MPRAIPENSVKHHFEVVIRNGIPRRKCSYCENTYSMTTRPDNLEKHLAAHSHIYKEYAATKRKILPAVIPAAQRILPVYSFHSSDVIDLTPTMNVCDPKDSDTTFENDVTDSFTSISDHSSSSSSPRHSYTSAQSLIASSIKSFQTTEFYDKLALCFAIHSLPHVLLESDAFIDLMRSANSYKGKLPNRKQLKSQMETLANKYTNEMLDDVASCLIPSALAIDS